METVIGIGPILLGIYVMIYPIIIHSHMRQQTKFLNGIYSILEERYGDS